MVECAIRTFHREASVSDAIEATSQQLNSPKDLKDEDATPEQLEARRWIGEIKSASKVFENYYDRVDAIYTRFRDERDGEQKDGPKEGDSQTRRYNALWSMKQTLKPLLYASAPNPYVTRRFDDSAPAARDAALLLQRALFSIAETDEFFDAGSEATDEYILAGRGEMWVTYLPEFAIRESEIKTPLAEGEEPPIDEYAEEDKESEEKPRYGVETDEDGARFYREKFEYKVNEKLVVESVNFKDLLHGPATKWRNVPWVARRVPLLRTELIKRFGATKGNAVPLVAYETGNQRLKSGNTDDFRGQFRRGIVWEIWDRINGEIVWVCLDCPNYVLGKKKDPLRLKGFFPCPKPMFGTMTTDSMIPVPDYTQWQDIALELDEVTYRISLLTDALRVAGVYDAEAGDTLKNIVEGRQNTMIPVNNWSQFAERGGLKGAVDFLSLEEIKNTIDALYRIRQQLVQEMYEITGIADIVRGASDPRETASAQKLKGNFANSRLTERQKIVARHIREMLNIIAEIICTLYSDENIMALSGAKLVLTTPEGQFDEARWQAALGLLRDEPLLHLQVKIDTETLADEQVTADRQEATEFITALSSLLQNAVAVSQSAPAAMPMVGKLIMLTVRKFKAGRSVEADIEAAVEKMANTPPQQQEEEAASGESGMNQLEHDIESKRLQLEQRELAIKEREIQIKEQELGIDWHKTQGELAARNRDLDIKQFKAQNDARLKDKQINTQAQGQQQQLQASMQQQQMQHEANERNAQHERMMREQDHIAGRQDARAGREDQLQRDQLEREDRDKDRQARTQEARARRTAVPA
jgi:hypothetical protein